MSRGYVANVDTVDGVGRDLYQKYRPLTWEGIIGQDATVKALRSTVINVRGLKGGSTGSLSPAYLFAGKHGCGKTTAAFVFARALNCPNVSEDGNPCNECDVCRSITMDGDVSGFSYQAASNAANIETVREIIRNAYARSPMPHPIWILDEFQALQKSNGAYDEFLHPIENGDLPTTFIFCTTDTKGIKPALISRCQQLNFAPVGRSQLEGLCEAIMASEHVRVVDESDPAAGDDGTITRQQIMSAVSAGAGSVRDTLSQLQVVRISDTGHGMSPADRLLRTVFVRRSVSETVGVVEDIENSGVDMSQVMTTMMNDCASMAKLADGGSMSAMYSTQVKDVAGMYPATLFIHVMDFLGESMKNATWNGNASGWLELALLKSVLLCGRQRIKGKR